MSDSDDIGSDIVHIDSDRITGKGDTPEMPDFNALARTQGDENRQSQILGARLGNPNERSLFGSRSVSIGRDGRSTVVNRLSRPLRRLFDSANQNYGQSFDMSGMPSAPDLNNNQSRDAMVNALVQREQPFMDRARSRQETQLANQGIMQGSEAYKSAQDDMARSENDFMLGAQQRAGDEQAREFDLMSKSRNNAMSEALMQRNLPMSELQSMMGMRDPMGGGGSRGGGGQPTDLYGAGQDQYAAQMGMYNANQARSSNMMSGLMGLGAAYMSSDRRVKTDIEPVGFTDSGLTVYQFKYIGSTETQYGLMSDEVREVFPLAVIPDENGIDRVDYSQTDYPRIH